MRASGVSTPPHGWWSRCRTRRRGRAISPDCWRLDRTIRFTIRIPSPPRRADDSAGSRCRATSSRRTGSTRSHRKWPSYGTSPTRRGALTAPTTTRMGKNAQDTYWNHIVRIDHNISGKQRFYVRANFTDLQRPENVRHNTDRRRQLLSLQQGAGHRRRLCGFPPPLSEHALYADPVHHRLPVVSVGLGFGGIGLLFELSSARSTAWIRAG